MPISTDTPSRKHPIHHPSGPVPLWHIKSLKARQDAYKHVKQEPPIGIPHIPGDEIDNLVELEADQHPSEAKELVEVQKAMIDFLTKTSSANLKEVFSYKTEGGKLRLHPAVTDLLKTNEPDHQADERFVLQKLETIAKLMDKCGETLESGMRGDVGGGKAIWTFYLFLAKFLDSIRWRFALNPDEEFAIDTVSGELSCCLIELLRATHYSQASDLVLSPSYLAGMAARLAYARMPRCVMWTIGYMNEPKTDDLQCHLLQVLAPMSTDFERNLQLLPYTMVYSVCGSLMTPATKLRGMEDDYIKGAVKKAYGEGELPKKLEEMLLGFKMDCKYAPGTFHRDTRMVRILPLIKSQFWVCFDVADGILVNGAEYKAGTATANQIEAKAVFIIGVGICGYVIFSSKDIRLDTLAHTENVGAIYINGNNEGCRVTMRLDNGAYKNIAVLAPSEDVKAGFKKFKFPV